MRLYDVNVSQGLVHALGRGHLECMTIYIMEVVAIVLVPNRRTDFIAVQSFAVCIFTTITCFAKEICVIEKSLILPKKIKGEINRNSW